MGEGDDWLDSSEDDSKIEKEIMRMAEREAPTKSDRERLESNMTLFLEIYDKVVVSLETMKKVLTYYHNRCSDLEKENEKLREENALMKKKVDAAKKLVNDFFEKEED